MTPPTPRRGRRRALATAMLGVAVLLSTALTGCQGGKAGESATSVLVPVADRRPAPLVRGVTLDGAVFDLGGLRGSTVVINVWGSWCAPCKKEQPDLVRAEAALRPRGVTFLGIAVRDTTAAAQAHVRRYAVPYPSLLDAGGRLVARFRDLPPTAVPSTVVIDAEGRVAARLLGATTYDELVTLVGRVAGT